MGLFVSETVFLYKNPLVKIDIFVTWSMCKIDKKRKEIKNIMLFLIPPVIF